MTTRKLTITDIRKLATNAAAKKLAHDVIAARAAAELTREQVLPYVMDVFNDREFFDDRTGERLAKPDDLYRCKNEPAVAEYFAAVDRAHRQYGWDLPKGYCPILVAESAVRDAEKALAVFVVGKLGMPEGAAKYPHADKLVDVSLRLLLGDRS